MFLLYIIYECVELTVVPCEGIVKQDAAVYQVVNFPGFNYVA